jgi:hypothetical protein
LYERGAGTGDCRGETHQDDKDQQDATSTFSHNPSSISAFSQLAARLTFCSLAGEPLCQLRDGTILVKVDRLSCGWCYFLVEDSSHGHVGVIRRDGDRARVRPGGCDGRGGCAVIGPSAEGGPRWRCQRHSGTNGIGRRAY